MEKPIYTVTTKSLRNYPKRDRSRTIGYYYDKDEAIDAVRGNACDMFECEYEYVVIEEIYQGIHYDVESETWFKWQGNDRYAPCDKPEELKNVCNFSIG